MTRTCERRRAKAAMLAAAVLTSASGCDAGHATATQASALAGTDVVRWKLPKRLREVSGLASTGDGELLAHDDERGIVYALDPLDGRLSKAFALGDPPVRDDFEGIAVAGANVYLMTSDGILYRARTGADGEHVPYERTDTGLGVECELEGLAHDAARALLLASCKAPRREGLTGRVGVFAWSIDRNARAPEASFAIDERALAEPIGARAFNPSSIEVSGDGTSVWLLAGRQRALAHVGLDGHVISVERLPNGHRQPEGLALGPAGELIVADEGGDGSATLTIYRPR